MSDTPLTDALIPSQLYVDETRMFHRSEFVPLLDHARMLERQLENAGHNNAMLNRDAIESREYAEAAIRALARARSCINGLLARTPVRDVSETLAEIDSVLTRDRESERGLTQPVNCHTTEEYARIHGAMAVAGKALAARRDEIAQVGHAVVPQYEPTSVADGLESIRQYGADTLSGRADGPADEAWLREGIREMVRRARVTQGILSQYSLPAGAWVEHGGGWVKVHALSSPENVAALCSFLAQCHPQEPKV